MMSSAALLRKLFMEKEMGTVFAADMSLPVPAQRPSSPS